MCKFVKLSAEFQCVQWSAARKSVQGSAEYKCVQWAPECKCVSKVNPEM